VKVGCLEMVKMSRLLLLNVYWHCCGGEGSTYTQYLKYERRGLLALYRMQVLRALCSVSK